MQYITVQYSSNIDSTVQYRTVEHITVQYSSNIDSTVQHRTVQHITVQYSSNIGSTVQHRTVQYITVQYSSNINSTVQCSMYYLRNSWYNRKGAFTKSHVRDPSPHTTVLYCKSYIALIPGLYGTFFQQAGLISYTVCTRIYSIPYATVERYCDCRLPLSQSSRCHIHTYIKGIY